MAPSSVTRDPAENPAPFTVSVKLPVGIELGETEVIAGATAAREVTVTVAEPDEPGATVLVARTVTAAGDGTVAGAVYLPPASMVPIVPSPPVMPLTLQITVAVAPVTVAVNACEPPVCTDVE